MDFTTIERMNNTVVDTTLFQINFISTAILTSIGLVGNPLVIYVFTRPQFIKVSMFRYLIASTIANLLNLLVNWPTVFPDAFLVNEVSFNCKIFYYLFYIPYQISPWILTLSSIDRYMSVKYPTTLQFRNEFKFQLMAIIGITIFICLANIPIYLFMDIEVGLGCVPINSSIQFYLDLTNALLGTLIPFVIMLVTACLIWHQFIEKRTALQQNSISKYKKEIKFIKTLFIINAYFLICYLPAIIYMLVYDIEKINPYGTFGFSILLAITSVFSACDFFVYFIFNKLFRRYIFSTVNYCRNKDAKNKVTDLPLTTPESK